MPKKLSNNHEQPEHRPKRTHLFLTFSLLSFAMFVVIGYVVVSAIRPGIVNFVASRQEADTVVFVNRLANRILLPEDFTVSSFEAKERFAIFVEGLQIPARIAVSVTNKEGEILVSDVSGYEGTILEQSPAFLRAARDLRSVALFATLNPKEQKLLGVQEAFEMFIPVTFGVSPKTAGVVHTLSRTGFIRKTISDLEQEMIFRISAGLIALYFLLSLVVWGASRTIRRQSGELARYAATLEKRVRERTEELERSTQREIAAIKEVVRLKEEFVFIASHELRALVTTMRWSIESLLKNEDFSRALREQSKTVFSYIETSVKRLHALIADLLDIARLESKTVKIEKKPLAIGSFLLPLFNEFAPVAEKKSVTIHADSQEIQAAPLVLGNEMKLREVFSNLLSNAIKFNKSNGKIVITFAPQNTFLEISVRDTGIGIKKSDMEKIFSKFFRAHIDIEGTGLGLWISKEIMRRLDGDITVASEEGVGSTFTVKIPRPH